MAYNILIVDDSPAMRVFVSRVLDLSGLPVGARFEAGDGQEAPRDRRFAQVREPWSRAEHLSDPVSLRSSATQALTPRRLRLGRPEQFRGPAIHFAVSDPS
jgi:hypothetical protein